VIYWKNWINYLSQIATHSHTINPVFPEIYPAGLEKFHNPSTKFQSNYKSQNQKSHPEGMSDISPPIHWWRKRRRAQYRALKGRMTGTGF